jgi:hypothetical protein
MERGDLEAALAHAQRAILTFEGMGSARDPEIVQELTSCLQDAADVLESLGFLDHAMALDANWMALGTSSGERHREAWLRSALKHMAAGEDAEAEQILRRCLSEVDLTQQWHRIHSVRFVMTALKPHIAMAELLEGRGTEEALAEARTLRDGVAQQLAEHEARKAAALEETRPAALRRQ